MCRLLGVVASELTEFGLGLTGAPRCLATLSREHPDGWGIAIHNASPLATPSEIVLGAWDLHRGTAPAGADDRFHALAAHSKGHVMVAHVRQKTVGPTRLENTHPFVKDGWVFAHNGTVKETDGLRAACSERRLGEIAGDTDSELLFAFLLTRMDEHGLTRLTSDAQRTALEELLARVTRDLREARVGAFNFLLSDGTTMFAHRFGRSLFVLDRSPGDPVRAKRDVGDGATIHTRWTSRRHAILVASERITDEPWREIEDGVLLRVERVPTPHVASHEPGTERLVAS
ncbi:MAG: Glutamine amidotransferase, class-II [Labilithrix sp.]|nr:Glutamine amidotransferase, class-II [Labilithrix sp.]